MDIDVERINGMLSIIMDSSHPMPNYVFHYYIDYKKKSEEKIFYNLIADSFLTLFSYCKLMFENAWSQAFALLRVGIEQVAAVFLLVTIPDALPEYIKLYDLKCRHGKYESEDDKRAFRQANNIPFKYTDFFDYSWIAKFTNNGEYGRDQLLDLAKLEELEDDIKQTLNAFSHGSLSIFQMSDGNWNVMKKYGRRANLICCKLYDYLCCSYHKLVGDNEFKKLPLNNYFLSFKAIYHDYFLSKGWFTK